MRLFETLGEAISEIRRDLYKGPVVFSERVQGIEKPRKAHETLNYVYTIADTETIPHGAKTLVKIGAMNFPFWNDDRAAMEEWLTVQLEARMNPQSHVTDDSDRIHPELARFLEGNTFAYNYAERMVGMFDIVGHTLSTQPTTRRAFWPIFTPHDAVRMEQMTRIPCTLGMDFILRDIPGHGPVLHCTLVQRSVDFEKFWLSDVWFAVQAQRKIAAEIGHPVGQLTHTIISFHAFEPDEEVY